ncbi:MAG: hypothetical protein RJA26_384 [Actinomycetota bacterium]
MTNSTSEYDASGLAERYGSVQEQITDACRLADRNRDEVTLIVVSKFHPADLVLNLIERLGRADEVPTWHFIGQLQSNKAKSVLRYASSIHSLDRLSLLEALAKERNKIAVLAQENGIPIAPATKVFIELNLTDDPDRGGIVPSNLLSFAELVLAAPGLDLVGVMGVASLEGQEERDFAAIQKASADLQRIAPVANLISAGMSNDFQTALRFGATHLRIGTAITGPRQYLT